jgi:hypothetical protein
MSDERPDEKPREEAEGQFRAAMARERQTQREQIALLKKGIFGCFGLLALILIVLFLFF